MLSTYKLIQLSCYCQSDLREGGYTFFQCYILSLFGLENLDFLSHIVIITEWEFKILSISTIYVQSVSRKNNEKLILRHVSYLQKDQKVKTSYDLWWKSLMLGTPDF